MLGRERHLSQTETGKSKERDGGGLGQHREAESPPDPTPFVTDSRHPLTPHVPDTLYKNF